MTQPESGVPGGSSCPPPSRPPPSRPPPRPSKRRPIRVAVLYNVDFADLGPDDPGYAARADVELVAKSIAATLDDGAHEAHLVSVDGDMHELRTRLLELEPDCAFNLCESLAGDARLETAVPLLVELLGIPCTGSSPEALSHALYKDRVKHRLAKAGVTTPAFCVMSRADDAFDLPFPVIVKPVREDGSAGITSSSVVRTREALGAVVADVAAAFRQPCLVERFIEGRELNVALFGFPTARVLPLSEIDFSLLPPGEPRVVSYAAKWHEDSPADRGTQPVLHPQLPPAVAARVRRAAVDAFRALGMRDYGRVDVRLDDRGVPYVVDVNPNCDLSRDAGMARAAAAVGIDYASLAKLLVRYALRRRRVSMAPALVSVAAKL